MKNLFSWIFVLSLSLVGIFVVSTVLHEEFHRFDFRDVEKTNEEICYLAPGKNMGYYTFYVLEGKEQDKVEEIQRFAEYKAYSIDILITFIYILCLVNLLKNGQNQ